MADTPKNEKWRNDFPTPWNDDNYVTRREFTRFLVLTSGALTVGSGYFVVNRPRALAAERPESMAVATVDEIGVGEVKLFRFPTENDPAILMRLADDQYVAYRQRCSHLSCPVTYNHAQSRLNCPCHNGAFDAATGNVLFGPPPSPLPKIALKIEGAQIYATGWESEHPSL